LRSGTDGVEERADKIENCALSALSAKFARGPDVFEGGMIMWREEKGEAVLAQSLRGLIRGQFDTNTKCFQDIGTAGLRRHSTIAVLGDKDARSRTHDCNRSRNVERVQTVAAGAANIQDFLGSETVPGSWRLNISNTK
jgi:hypothetical protein